MNDIDDATKRAVRAAIKKAREHMKNAEMFLKGWVPEGSWPSSCRWKLSDELHKACEALWTGQEAVIDSRKDKKNAATKP